jgi:L-cysteine:1D-myo-inositol 2-amino-2-deoxy-alpha-D-glucopyranoside ligase
MVYKDGEKMSKSLGNLVFVSDLVQTFDARSIRLTVLNNHYRTPWEWADSDMDVNQERLRSWVAAGTGSAALDAVRSALDSDLDTPGAIEAIDRAAKAGNGVSEAAALLGVSLDRPVA